MTTTNAINQAASDDAISCDLTAIPAEERSAHIALARSLFFADEFSDELTVRQAADSVTVELPVERLADAVRFVENERRCCRHLAFSLEVPPHGARLTLRVSGPGVRDELHALARTTADRHGGPATRGAAST